MNQDYAYAYNDENGTLNSMTVSSGSTTDTLNYSYDALQRLTSQTTSGTSIVLAKEYAYKNLSGNRTTTQVSGYTAKVNGTTVDSYSYTYDNLGNITTINHNGYAPLSYTYDAQNQLIKVVEGDFRYEYAYDTYGNILSVKTYEEATDELMSSNTYSYTNTQWVDQLMAFNGVGFEYDDIGNPTKYYNGSNYTFTWDGRELATAVKGSTSVSYKYGADGLRTQKTVGSTVYDYYYIDGLLVRQTWGTNYMDFLYDESGTAYSFIYNGTQYYYVKNLQGDVVKILNASGSVVANYSYDAWGKVTNSGNIIGLYNPIRYRGYYYDTDTGFYYLQSRYYDPAIKRFINADGYINANGDLLGFNMYAYCGNNPINYIDPTGEAWEHWIAGAAIVGLCAIATVVTCGGFAAAATAVALVASGTAAATVTSTIAASAFITSSMALGTVALSAAMDSSSLEDFGDQGNWGTVVSVATSAVGGGAYGYDIASSYQLPFSNSQQVIIGTKQAKEHGAVPNSRYLQYDQATGKLRCDVVYNSNGDWYSRVDYMHDHKINGIPYRPHIHISAPLNQFGQPIGRERVFPWEG